MGNITVYHETTSKQASKRVVVISPGVRLGGQKDSLLNCMYVCIYVRYDT